MPSVKVRENEPLDSALRRFKRKCERSGVLSEVKRRAQFEKPSERKKRKAVMARKKLRKRLAKEQKLGM